jgi:hypothetical protein
MKKYKSKIGFGIALFMAVVFIGTSILMIIEHAWLGLAVNIVVVGFIIHIFLNTYYIINGNDLIIKCGFLINRTIKIDQIKKIEETNNVLSSPAASLDRIAIDYDKFDSVMISPKEKMDFINQLIKINDKIVVVLKKGAIK